MCCLFIFLKTIGSEIGRDRYAQNDRLHADFVSRSDTRYDLRSHHNYGDREEDVRRRGAWHVCHTVVDCGDAGDAAEVGVGLVADSQAQGPRTVATRRAARFDVVSRWLESASAADASPAA